MQRIISKYGLAAHLAILAVAPLFLLPTQILWLAGLVAVWVIMEPSRVGNEMLHEARDRVASKIRKDPFFWLMLVVAALVGFRWINSDITMIYNAEISEWTMAKPQFEYMPAAVKGNGAMEFSCALTLLVVATGCKNALGRSARMAFLLVLSAITAFIAFKYEVNIFEDNTKIFSLTECALNNPSYIGVIFGSCFVAAAVALVAAFERKWRLATPVALLAVIGNASGLFLFSPVWQAAIYLVACILIVFYAFAYSFKALPKSGAFKFLVAFGVSVVFSVMLVMAVMPESALPVKVAPFKDLKFFDEGYFAIRDTLSAIAMRAWKSQAWLGSGLGSFQLDIRFLADEQTWQVVKPDQTMPLNGYWLILAERGIVGAALIAFPMSVLIWMYIVRMVKGVKSISLKEFALPQPATLSGILVLLGLIATTLFDCSIVYPGMLTIAAAMLSIAAASFPSSKEKHNG